MVLEILVWDGFSFLMSFSRLYLWMICHLCYNKYLFWWFICSGWAHLCLAMFHTHACLPLSHIKNIKESNTLVSQLMSEHTRQFLTFVLKHHFKEFFLSFCLILPRVQHDLVLVDSFSWRRYPQRDLCFPPRWVTYRLDLVLWSKPRSRHSPSSLSFSILSWSSSSCFFMKTDSSVKVMETFSAAPASDEETKLQVVFLDSAGVPLWTEDKLYFFFYSFISGLKTFTLKG